MEIDNDFENENLTITEVFSDDVFISKKDINAIKNDLSLFTRVYSSDLQSIKNQLRFFKILNVILIISLISVTVFNNQDVIENFISPKEKKYDQSRKSKKNN